MSNKNFDPKPVDGCDDCAWLTEETETPMACEECEHEQYVEYLKKIRR